MTAKQILDSFSQTLIQDERILSPQERQLLMSLLQNAKAHGSNPEIQSAVTATIARSVGETVAQRAFTLLGSSIVERIVARSGAPGGIEETTPAATVELGSPHPPKPPSGPEAPNVPSRRLPKDQPLPGPPGGTSEPPEQQAARQSQLDSGNNVVVLDAPAIVRAQFVVLDEFLAPQELDELISYTLRHEAKFQTSTVISPSGDPGVIDYNHRRSRVLMDLGEHQEVILQRIRCVLPRVLDQLGFEEFPVSHLEAQITASNDGDFFRTHSDDAQETISGRRITFVYFFHCEPRQFEGGELRLYDSRGSAQHHVSAGSYQSILPQQNQILFFPCSVLHEITPVKCPSRAFADSRFTLNGWLHK